MMEISRNFYNIHIRTYTSIPDGRRMSQSSWNQPCTELVIKYQLATVNYFSSTPHSSPFA